MAARTVSVASQVPVDGRGRAHDLETVLGSRAGPLRIVVVLAASALCGGCGGDATVSESNGGGPGTSAAPVTVFVPSDACAAEVAPGEADALFGTDISGEAEAVVEVFFAAECTGLGGQYVLARDVALEQAWWLGGHGCQFFPDGLVGPSPMFGALRYSQTAALFTIDEGICVGFPGQDGVQSSGKVLAIALFETRAGAEAFLGGT